jgi:hypothetical protein
LGFIFHDCLNVYKKKKKNHSRSNLLRQSTSSLKSASPIEDLSDDVDWRSKMNSVFFGIAMMLIGKALKKKKIFDSDWCVHLIGQ